MCIRDRPEEHRPIGHWGRLHQSYLKQFRPMVYSDLLLSGKLHTVLADLNEQATDRLNPVSYTHLPLDLLVGLCCGAGLRLAVYLRGKNAKKYRHGMEYGSARWGGPKDIEPFMAPKFEDNIILTKTERLMMSNRPPDPKNARNKNVLVVGGSGSGKTRFWLKPNLLQCHSSYVITDPKGYTWRG